MQKTCLLTTENIDVLSADIHEFLKKQKQQKEHIIKARLSAEAALLRWLEGGYQDKEITLECNVKFGRPVVRLLVVGEQLDPLEVKDEYDDFVNVLQENLGNTVTYSYARKNNVVEIKLPFKPFAMWQKNIVAVILAVITWGIISFTIPSIAPVLNNQFITPTFKMLMGLLKALASFMVFFNVLNAICHMGDVDTLSKLGVSLIKKAEKSNFSATVLIGIVGYFAFDVVSTDGSVSVGVFGDIYKMLLNIVPNSLVQPFINGNSLQILFIAVCGGILLLILGQQAQTTFKSVGELNSLFMMAIVRSCTFIPLVVYLSFTSLLLSDKFSLLLKMWKIPTVVYGVGITFFFLEFLYIATKNKFNFSNYFGKIFPVALLGYTTASTMPCIPLMTKTLKEGGVRDNYRDFALPLCQILCPSGIIISMSTVAMGLAEMAGIKLSLSTYVVIMFSVFLLAQTVPPVTGASISVMILILAQINVPQEFIAPFVSIDYFLNMMRVAVNKASAMNVVFDAAKQEGEME